MIIFAFDFKDIYFPNVTDIIGRHLEHVLPICSRRVTPGKHRALNRSIRSAKRAYPGWTESYSGDRRKRQNFHAWGSSFPITLLHLEQRSVTTLTRRTLTMPSALPSTRRCHLFRRICWSNSIGSPISTSCSSFFWTGSRRWALSERRWPWFRSSLSWGLLPLKMPLKITVAVNRTSGSIIPRVGFIVKMLIATSEFFSGSFESVILYIYPVMKPSRPICLCWGLLRNKDCVSLVSFSFLIALSSSICLYYLLFKSEKMVYGVATKSF